MTNLNLLFIFSLLLSFLTACNQSEFTPYGNPAAPNFDLAGSDKKAITIADEVMEASGGRENWDNARYFSWVFANRRKHYWDKLKGDIRIESFPDSTIYLMNINTMEGKVNYKGKNIENPDSLKTFLQKGKSIWINDSYWLVMPFKMKDDGVRLKYLGDGKTEEGRLSDVLEMTFINVGDTPNNKYHICVDKGTRLVTEWSFFKEATQDTANFTMPWNNYQQYGKLFLSDDREKIKLSEIAIMEQFPDSIFTAH